MSKSTQLLRMLTLLTVFAGSQWLWAGPQQEKMKQCNEQATGKAGDDRKAFMSQCLSAKAETTVAPATGGPGSTPIPVPPSTPANDGKATPQQRMKDCNAKAKGMKGKDRREFMSTCLKGG